DWKVGFDADQKHHRENVVFLNEVHSLIKELNESHSSAASAENVSGGPIRGIYDVYTHILSYRKICQGDAVDRSKNSHLFTGCKLLEDLFTEADDFMSSVAWLSIGTTLFNLADRAEVASDLTRLKKLKN